MLRVYPPIYYTFLLSFLLSSQQEDTSTNTPLGVGVRSCVASLLNLLSSLWLRLDRSSMELCFMRLCLTLQFFENHSSFSLTLFFHCFRGLIPRGEEENNNASAPREGDASSLPMWAKC